MRRIKQSKKTDCLGGAVLNPGKMILISQSRVRLLTNWMNEDEEKERVEFHEWAHFRLLVGCSLEDGGENWFGILANKEYNFDVYVLLGGSELMLPAYFNSDTYLWSMQLVSRTTSSLWLDQSLHFRKEFKRPPCEAPNNQSFAENQSYQTHTSC